MQPIVNPIFIYLLSILDGIHNLITIFILLSIIVFIVPIFLIVLNWFDSYGITSLDESVVEKCKPYIKKGLIYFIFFNLLGTLIPTKETAIMVYTSKFVTVNNINTSKEFLLNTFQEVMDIINEKGDDTHEN